MALLEVNNIIKYFDKQPILKGISFNLNEGEVMSIIGRSGCGKTTLLRCLNYLENIDDGSVTLNNELILDNTFKKKSDKELIKYRKKYGLVFQNFNLFPQYTCYQNIRLPLYLAMKKEGKVDETVIDKTVLDLLNKVGLIDKKDQYPGNLSGGQQQRVAIARALALQPEILCFDEPTSALDPELTNEVLKVILELKNKLHLTMIIVTHEMNFAKNVSDKMMFMKDGEIVEIGKPKEVFNSSNPEVKAFISSFYND